MAEKINKKNKWTAEDIVRNETGEANRRRQIWKYIIDSS